MSNQDLIQRVAELDAAASPAPWSVVPAHGDFKASESRIIGPRGKNLLFASDNGKHGQAENRDAIFMAESRTLMPLLARRLSASMGAERERCATDEVLRGVGIVHPLGYQGVLEVVDRLRRAETEVAELRRILNE